MHLKAIILVCLVLGSFSKMVCAQELRADEFKALRYGTSSESTIIALVDQKTLSNPFLVFDKGQLSKHNISAYLFLNTISVETLYNKLNRLNKSKSPFFDRNALQLLLMGTQNELERYELLDLNYFSSHFFISIDTTLVDQPFTTIKISEWNCEEYLKSVKWKYLWLIDKEQRKSPKDSLLDHIDGKLTIGYTPSMNIGLNNNNLGDFSAHGLNFGYSFGKKLQLFAEADFSITRPKIEDEIQSQMRSQIDIVGIMDGTVTQQKVTLSVPIQGETYTSVSLGFKYNVYEKEDFSFYTFTKLSRINSQNISGQLDTTFTLVFNGSSPTINAGELNRGAVGIEENQAITINSGLGAGANLKIRDNWSFDFSIYYSTGILNVRVTDGLKNNSLIMVAGLNYRFMKKKEFSKIYYW